MSKPRYEIVVCVILGCIMMSIVEAVIRPSYVMKSLAKCVIFLFCIWIFYWKHPQENFWDIFQVKEKRSMWIACGLGVAVYALILGAYFLAKNFIDFSMITTSLLQKEKITKENFLWVALYISVVNSLLEELFFRGFAFLQLRKWVTERTAHGWSAVCFACYHIFIMSNWFSLGMFVLLFFSLVVAGLFLNGLDRGSSIYPSWLVHLSANLSINTIGCLMFGILG